MKKNDYTKREINYDCLRVICTALVILLHQGMNYVGEDIMEYPSYYFAVGNFYHSVTRCAVPCFVMLSGAFLLDNENNKNVRVFYRKTWFSIILPTIMVGLGYVCLGALFDILKDHNLNWLVVLAKHFYQFLIGNSYYHMWFMYMMIGIYLIVPFLIRLKNYNVWYLYFFGLIFIIADMAHLFPRLTFFWIFWGISYLGYFVLGFFIRKSLREIGNTVILIVLSFLCMIGCYYVESIRLIYNKTVTVASISVYDFLVFGGSFFLFWGFSNITIKSEIVKKVCIYLAPKCIYIYLFHAGVMTVINPIFERCVFHDDMPNPIYYIPIMFIIYFLISLLGAQMIYFFLQKIKKRQ